MFYRTNVQRKTRSAFKKKNAESKRGSEFGRRKGTSINSTVHQERKPRFAPLQNISEGEGNKYAGWGG